VELVVLGILVQVLREMLELEQLLELEVLVV
jgi:hypothetical protein